MRYLTATLLLLTAFLAIGLLILQCLQPTLADSTPQSIGLRIFLSQVFAVLVAVSIAGIGIQHRRAVLRHLTAFFTTADGPLNLAVFRIVVFALVYRYVAPVDAVWYTQMEPDQSRGWAYAANLPDHRPTRFDCHKK